MKALLAHRRFAGALAIVAALLSLAGVGGGWVLDDYVLRAVSLGRGAEVGLPGSRFDLFTFFSDVPADHRAALDSGWAPWWSSSGNRLHFFWPLSSFTHWLEFQLWPGSPLAMHLVNVAIYGALVLAVALLYRRMFAAGPSAAPAWVAGLAAAFYAFNPGHGQSVAFIAGRNTILAALFGVLSLAAHDRARREGWRPGTTLSAALFAASLCAGESGTATAAYLLAYAWCLEPDAKSRVRSLVPHALVALAWAAAYVMLRHGARESSLYLDPGHDPLGYLREAIVRVPVYLQAQIGLPLASLFALLSVPGRIAFGILTALFCAAFARFAWPVLRQDRTARFFAVGMVLSVLPLCAIIPNERVLFCVGLGAMGLVARLAASAHGGLRRAMVVFLVVVHGPLAVPYFLFNVRSLDMLAAMSRTPLDEILLEPEVPRQTPVFVNAPAHFLISHLAAMRIGTDKPVPLRWRYLAPGLYPLTLTRLDERALSVRASGGLLQPPGTWNVEGQPRDPLINFSYGAQYFAQVVRRADDPMGSGDRVQLSGVTLEVREVTSDGRPVEVVFTFAELLESPSLRWFAWDHGRYVPFTPPRIGGSVTLGVSTMMP
jgi:hypothetical protein